MPDFIDTVALGWSATLFYSDPFGLLDYKFRSVAKTLKSWSARRVGSIRFQLALASGSET